MSNTNESLKPGEFQYKSDNSAGQPLNERQMKVKYAEALAALEKQHKLQKLQSEIAVYRVQEVQANMHYLKLLREANAEQAAEQQKMAPKSETAQPPVEESVETISKTSIVADEPNY